MKRLKMNPDTQQLYSLSQGKFYAAMMEFHLREKCTHFSIAGSVRRNAPQIKDLEIVCVPRFTEISSGTLFDDTYPVNNVAEWVQKEAHSDAVIEKNGPKYIKFTYQGFPIDLFMTTPEEYGRMLAIRTGPSSFSKRMAKRWVEKGYHGKDGILIHEISGQRPHPFHTEKAFFDWLGWKYINPELRK